MVKKVIFTLIITSEILSTDAQSSVAFLETTLGTSFSPYGNGLELGYDFGENLLLSIGTGYSKYNELGYPLALKFQYRLTQLSASSATAEILPFIGFTRYKGQGSKRVLHEGSSPGETFNRNVRWDLDYTQLGLTLNVKEANSNCSYIGTVGLAGNSSSHIELVDRYNSTNLGNAIGISVDDSLTAAGRGDFGLFVSTGLKWSI